jgi:hypothetical protein
MEQKVDDPIGSVLGKGGGDRREAKTAEMIHGVRDKYPVKSEATERIEQDDPLGARPRDRVAGRRTTNRGGHDGSMFRRTRGAAPSTGGAF